MTKILRVIESLDVENVFRGSSYRLRFFSSTDLLRGQPSGRLGLLGHGLLDGREGQYRNNRCDRRSVQPRLCGQQRSGQPSGVQHDVGAAGGQADGCGDQHESDARHAGGRVRQRGQPQLGVR